jgi:hypothetical protein
MSHAHKMAYEVSTLEALHEGAAAARAIKAATDSGRFVVVYEGPSYCPRTDALLHSPYREVLADFATRAEAERFAAAQYPDEPAECDFIVYPKLPRAKPAPVDLGEYDIPF